MSGTDLMFSESPLGEGEYAADIALELDTIMVESSVSFHGGHASSRIVTFCTVQGQLNRYNTNVQTLLLAKHPSLNGREMASCHYYVC